MQSWYSDTLVFIISFQDDYSFKIKFLKNSYIFNIVRNIICYQNLTNISYLVIVPCASKDIQLMVLLDLGISNFIHMKTSPSPRGNS